MISPTATECLQPDLRSTLAERAEILCLLHSFAVLIENDAVIFANHGAAALLHHDQSADLLGMTLGRILHPDYSALAEVPMEALAEDGKIPVKFMTRTGGELDVEMWVSVVPGIPGGMYLVEARDVTEHLKAAKALQLREQRLEGIIKTVADGIISIDARGHIQTFNPAAERIFGFKAEEIIGESISRLIPMPVTAPAPAGAPPPAGSPPDHAADAPPVLANGEVVGKRKDGQTIPLEMAVRENPHGGALGFTGIVRDISQRKIAEDRLRQLAHFDALTGLPNRFLFGDRLEVAVRRGERNGRRLALAFIDLDHFKPVNDRHGHAAGDKVLVQIARRLSHCVRKTDTVARLGGDEFVAIIEDIPDIETVERIARKILGTLSAPISIDGADITIGGCIGIALFPDHAGNLDDLLHAADKAMYLAKEGGRNAYCFHGGAVAHYRPRG